MSLLIDVEYTVHLIPTSTNLSSFDMGCMHQWMMFHTGAKDSTLDFSKTNCEFHHLKSMNHVIDDGTLPWPHIVIYQTEV